MAIRTETRPSEVSTVRSERIWAILLAVGAVFMFGRTLQLIWNGTIQLYVAWVGALLAAELAVNTVTVLTTGGWALNPTVGRRRVALRAVSTTVLVHAARVLVFVLGRTGPWVDFDVRPGFRSDHAEQWSWFGVWFAGTMATVSVVVLVVGWLIVRRRTHQGEGQG